MSWTKKYSDKVSQLTGIQLGIQQIAMVESRIKKRMIELKISTSEEYEEYFQKNETNETNALVSLLTTHHTFFFREFRHFEFLEQKALEICAQKALERGDKKIKIWSAACSKGQEVYSLAMYLNYHLPQIAPGIDFEIFGTDVDPESVNFAKNGVYLYDEIKEIPLHYLSKNWARGTGDISVYAKAKENIKSKCKFDVLNLQDFNSKIKDKEFDIIFCRNVFIYFNPEQIKSITSNLIKKNHDHGFLIVGLSESLSSLGLGLETQGPSIYTQKITQKANIPKEKAKNITVSAGIQKREKFVFPEIIRVLCVDDSPSIHTLLKQILSKKEGFEIVGNAKSGKEAEEIIKKQNNIDILTLDIHMPEMNGVEYLEKNYNSLHPPVVMVSSVSREDSSLALRALKAGALDYVEKPSLTQINEKGEEIRTKLRCSYRAFHEKKNFDKDISFDQDSAKKIELHSPEKMLRVIYCHYSDLYKLKLLTKEWKQNNEPSVIVFVDGIDSGLVHSSEEVAKHIGKSVGMINASKDLKNIKLNEWYVCSFVNTFEEFVNSVSSYQVSFLVLGEATKVFVNKVKNYNYLNILVEDHGENLSKLKDLWFGVARDIVPLTSFSYMSNDYLNKLEKKDVA